MKTAKNILITFILNLLFSVFEFIGCILTGSIAITSDAVHDMCDAVSIGFSYFFEMKSRKKPDEIYTYGYARYSVIGGFVTTLILVVSSVLIIWNSANRIINPSEINYNGMIIFAVVGVLVNTCAAIFTRGKESLNQKAVNLHMIEDVLGWVVVLIGSVVMKFTDFVAIDAIMSVGVSLFIHVNAILHLKKILVIFLDKIPDDVDIKEIRTCLCGVEEVLDVHHIHIRSVDGQNNYASLHVVTDAEPYLVKEKVRRALGEKGIGHVTIEIEKSAELCDEQNCSLFYNSASDYRHHHK